MRDRAQLDAGLVVQGKPVDDVRTGFVVSDDFDFACLSAQARDDLVEHTDGRNVPEVRARYVDGDSVSAILGMEGAGEPIEAKNISPRTR